MRSQPRLPRHETRRTLPSCVQRQIDDAVTRDALRWDCSRSWIVATALAAFYGLDIMKPYDVKRRKKVA